MRPSRCFVECGGCDCLVSLVVILLLLVPWLLICTLGMEQAEDVLAAEALQRAAKEAVAPPPASGDEERTLEMISPWTQVVMYGGQCV